MCCCVVFELFFFWGGGEDWHDFLVLGCEIVGLLSYFLSESSLVAYVVR